MERLSAPERTREELRALMNGDLGTAAGPRRSGAPGAAPDRRGGARGRSQRRAWPRALRARRGRESGLPQWLSAGQDQDGGRARWNIRRRRSATRPSRSSRACGRRFRGRTRELERLAVELYARGPVDARHRGHVHRRDRPTASVAGGGERDHRAAVGRVRGVLQARSLRARHRLPVRRRHRRAAAAGPAARGGAGRLGHRRGRAQGRCWG